MNPLTMPQTRLAFSDNHRSGLRSGPRGVTGGGLQLCLDRPLSRLAAAFSGACIVLLTFASSAFAADVPVSVSSDVFTPAVVNINVGDSVTWNNVQGTHNVVADDGAFRSGDPLDPPWSFTHTYTEPGTHFYYCEVHGGPGAQGHSGTVFVAEGDPGEVSFATRNFVVDEDAGVAIITVRRTGGTARVASVNYTTGTEGTAESGIDFEETAGTLTWDAGDGNDKTFSIPIFDDAEVEGSEVLPVRLVEPIGAALGVPAASDLTIVDDEETGSICEASDTNLCLFGDRFSVRATFVTPAGVTGQAKAVVLTDSTGYLWFFTEDNVEAVVKIRNGCPNNGHYWFFAGGLTNVQVRLRVTDTLTGQVKIYANPLRTPFQPIQDTRAFATCP